MKKFLLIVNFDLIDTKILRALAILSVVLHNYFHNIQPAPGENEFTFDAGRIVNVVRLIVDSPFDFLHPFFSFFGHYGVFIFIFLSGYGLTKKVDKIGNNSEIFVLYKIIAKQIYKIIKLSFIGAIFVYIYRFLLNGNLGYEY